MKETLRRSFLDYRHKTFILETKTGKTKGSVLYPKNYNGNTMVVVHGSGVDRWFGYHYLFFKLLIKGYRVFTFDVDGHGKNNTTYLSYPESLECLPMVLKQGIEYGILDEKNFMLLGQSLGGVIVMNYLGNYPAYIPKCWISVSTPHTVTIHPRTILEFKSLFSWVVLKQLEYYRFRELFPNFIQHGTGSVRTKGFIWNDFFGFFKKTNLIESVPKSKVPCLFVHATNDYMVPVSQAYDIYALYKGEKKLLVDKEAGHLTVLLRSLVLLEIAEWLEKYI